MKNPKRTHGKPLTRDTDLDAATERFAQAEPSQDAARDDKVRLVEREGSEHPLLIYATPKGIRVDLPYRDDSLWASQRQMAEMFGVTPQNITIHLKNIFADGELDEATVCKKSLQTGTDGKRYQTKTYDMNAIISVGYRVSSKQGTMFRIWATDRLVQILTKGFFVDKVRLKNEGAPDALDEFREIAREIRASIRNSYREVLQLCTLCADYDGRSESARAFFMEMENKLL